jgi:hypothetical protein
MCKTTLPNDVETALIQSAEIIEQLVKDVGGCEHDVNICICYENRLLDDIASILVRYGRETETAEKRLAVLHKIAENQKKTGQHNY